MYVLNVSLNGNHHFATAEHSITSLEKARLVKEQLEAVFPEGDGYAITCSKRMVVSENVEIKPLPKPPSDALYAVRRLLDSVWTLCFRLVDGQVEILSYDRDNPIGYKREKYLPVCRLVETENRIVTEVKIDNYLFEVSNQQHVFSYKLS